MSQGLGFSKVPFGDYMAYNILNMNHKKGATLEPMGNDWMSPGLGFSLKDLAFKG